MSCIENAASCIFDQILAKQLDYGSLQVAGETFVEAFDSPEPILDQVTATIEGSFEIISFGVFSSIFIVIVIIIWFLVAKSHSTWQEGLFLTVIVAIILIAINYFAAVKLDIFLKSQYKVIDDTYDSWVEKQVSTVIPALNDASCKFTSISTCPPL